VGFIRRAGGEEMGARNSAAATPVLLNVYDLTAANDYLYWLGFGVFHSGIEGSHGDLSSSLSFPFLLFSVSVLLR
jgi:hypothetical protein